MNWHPAENQLLAAVGDDGFLGFYDLRNDSPVSLFPRFPRLTDRTRVHAKECNVVRYNPHFPRLFITAGSEGSVKLWDERNLGFPVHELEGHTGAVFAGAWNPTCGSVLATTGQDRRVIVWDLERVGGERGVQ